MTRSELYSKIVLEIALRLRQDNKITEEEYLCIGYDPREFTCLYDIGDVSLSYYKLFLDNITQHQEDLDIDITPPFKWGIHIEHFDTNHSNSLKDLVTLSPDCYVTTDTRISNEFGEARFSSNLWMFIERYFAIALLDRNKETLIDHLFQMFVNPKNDTYIVLAHKNINATYLWNLYSYSVLWYLNEKELSIPTELQFKAGTKLTQTLSYKKGAPYTQLYEIFEVLQESKSDNNVLSRYMHLFQVLEHMAFRVKMVQLSKTDNIRRGFLHKVLAMTNHETTNEKNIFEESWKILFPNVRLALTPVEKQTYNQTLYKLYGKSQMLKTSNDIVKLTDLLYLLRNSIVHNKECEVHFCFGNVEDYKEIIGLIRKLIALFEPAIIDIISNSRSKLKYHTNKIDLY